jgi:hypothetical protein
MCKHSTFYSPHILQLPILFFHQYIGKIQSVIFTCFINPAFNNLSSFALTNNCNRGFILLTSYIIGMAPRIKEMRCSTISLEIPLSSSNDHANVSLNLSTKSLYSLISRSSNLDTIFICLTFSLLVFTSTYLQSASDTYASRPNQWINGWHGRWTSSFFILSHGDWCVYSYSLINFYWNLFPNCISL